MQDFFQEIDVSEDQAEAIARGLFAIARADGELHDTEAGLITEFFASIVDRPSDFGALQRDADITTDALAAALPRPDLRQLFIKGALLLAYCDGKFGDGERKLIGIYAEALSIDQDAVNDLEVRVKEFLLSQLSHLANVEAAAEVAKELDV